MTREEFIHKKIEIVHESMVSFQIWSIVLFAIAVASIGLSFIRYFENTFIMEFVKYGLSSISTLSGAALQGVKYLRKNKLIELEFCESVVAKYETLEEFDKIIVNKALDGIFNK